MDKFIISINPFISGVYQTSAKDGQRPLYKVIIFFIVPQVRRRITQGKGILFYG